MNVTFAVMKTPKLLLEVLEPFRAESLDCPLGAPVVLLQAKY